MKKVMNSLLAVSTALVIFSCRKNDVPEDTHDHDEIAKTTVTITDKITKNVQVVNFTAGKTDNNFKLEQGKTYTVGVEFFTKHNDKYESAMDMIKKEREEHFITYKFAGVDANVIRTDDDIIRGDGKRLGVKMEWTVTSTPVDKAVFNLKLYHHPKNVKQDFPSATNQQGYAEGSDMDVNANFDIK